MRTLGFRTHVLMALAAAAGLVHSLGLPWYAAAPPPVKEEPGIGELDGPLNAFFEGLKRWVTDPGGSTGWDTLAHWGTGIGAMAAVAAIGGLCCLLPALQPVGRDLLR